MKRRRKKSRRNQPWLYFFVVVFLLFVLCARQGILNLSGAYAVGMGTMKGSFDISGTARMGFLQSQSLFQLQDVADKEAGTILNAKEIDMGALDKYFTIQEIGDDIFRHIDGKSYRENSHISIDELRYLKLLHYNYEHQIQVGELIVNAEIAEDCRKIFRELFEQEYEIASMYLIDNYWTGNSGETDTASIEQNNTSAFHYRAMTGSDTLSNHALGYAVDVNPLQNPYVSYGRDGSFAQYYKDMELYLDRSSGAEHMITHEDLCYRTFIKYGFTWGGDWEEPKDYQHFEKRIN